MDKEVFRTQTNVRSTQQYQDLLEMNYPLERKKTVKHLPMKIADRAKIFAPFAALKGYEKAIAAKQKIVVPRIDLSEEAKEYLDMQLQKIEEALSRGEHPVITIIYFQKDKRNNVDSGEYIKFTGMTSKFEVTSHILQIVDKRFRLEDIYDIQSEEI